MAISQIFKKKVLKFQKFEKALFLFQLYIFLAILRKKSKTLDPFRDIRSMHLHAEFQVDILIFGKVIVS